MPAISVVLPFFNAENTLDEAVSSIARQSFCDWELILIDNHSTDKSAEIARSWSRRMSNIKLLCEKKQGVSYAINRGLKESAGEFIARMDADDISYPDRLEKQYLYLQENPEVSLVFSRVECPETTIPNEGLQEYIQWSNKLCSWEEMRRNSFVEYPGVNPSLMIRMEVYKAIGTYKQGDFPEDYEFYLRALAQGFTAAKLPEVLLCWRDSNTRLTRSDPRYSRAAFQKVKSKYLSSALKRNCQEWPAIWIWGAGKLARKWSELLASQGAEIQGYIEVDRRKLSEKPRVIDYKDIAIHEQRYIVSLVSNRGIREEIRSFLISKGYLEEKDFIIAA